MKLCASLPCRSKLENYKIWPLVLYFVSTLNASQFIYFKYSVLFVISNDIISSLIIYSQSLFIKDNLQLFFNSNSFIIISDTPAVKYDIYRYFFSFLNKMIDCSSPPTI